MSNLPDQLRDLIETGPLAHLSTINEDGSPQVTVIWIGLDGDEIVSGHMSHHRKLCNIETYAPTDNVSELTARTNDEGWEGVFVNWLKLNSRSNMIQCILRNRLHYSKPQRLPRQRIR